MDWLKYLSELGAAGASVALVVLFLRHMRDTEKQREALENAMRTSIEAISTSAHNCILENTKALGEASEVNRNLSASHDKVIDALNSLGQ